MKRLIILSALQMLFPVFLWAEIITDTSDGDNDYIPDQLENLLALDFRPKLHIAQQDLAIFYPNQTWHIPFSVDSYINSYNNKVMLVISYGIAFIQDTGYL